MNHLIAITVKYLCPTNTKGSRVKMSLPRWDNKSRALSWRNELPNNSADQAEHYLTEAGIVVESYADIGDSYVLLVSFKQADKVKEFFKVD